MATSVSMDCFSGRIIAWLAGRAGGHGRDVALAAPEWPSLRALKAVRDGWFSIAALVQSSIRMAGGRWEADVSGDLHGASRRSSQVYHGDTPVPAAMMTIPMRAARPSLSENSTYAPITASEANNDAMTAVTAMFWRAPKV